MIGQGWDAARRALKDAVPKRTVTALVSLADAACVALLPKIDDLITDLAHLVAAAFAVMVRYALTNPQHAPWRTTARILSADVLCRNGFKSICASSHHGCLEDVRPWRVVNAVMELLQEGADARRRASC